MERDNEYQGPGTIPADGIPPFDRPSLLVLHRGAGVVFVIDKTERDGWPRLGLRMWVYHEGPGWIPTRGGLSVSPAEADRVGEAMARGLAEIVAEERRLMDAIAERRARGGRP